MKKWRWKTFRLWHSCDTRFDSSYAARKQKWKMKMKFCGGIYRRRRDDPQQHVPPLNNAFKSRYKAVDCCHWSCLVVVVHCCCCCHRLCCCCHRRHPEKGTSTLHRRTPSASLTRAERELVPVGRRRETKKAERGGLFCCGCCTVRWSLLEEEVPVARGDVDLEGTRKSSSLFLGGHFIFLVAIGDVRFRMQWSFWPIRMGRKLHFFIR